MLNIHKKKKYSTSFIKLTEKDINSYFYSDLSLMGSNFKYFCKKNNIDYIQAKIIGLDKSKDLLRRYFTDEIDGNLSKQDCENLYTLFEDPWDNSKLERHRLLVSFINTMNNNKKSPFNKILILGAGTGGEYEQLNKFYPKAIFIITDISEKALTSFHLKYNEKCNYTTHILDIFSNKSLSNFIKLYDKFDLIIASGVYRYAPTKQIKYNSAKFIYKNILKEQGLFCIVEVSQEPKYDDPFILRRIIPIFKRKVQTKMRINPAQFVFYKKNFTTKHR